jgi:hypothetical protein
MKKISLSVPQLVFVVGTRAALAAGVAMLFSRKLNDNQRRAAGSEPDGHRRLDDVSAARLVLNNRRPLAKRLRVADLTRENFHHRGTED